MKRTVQIIMLTTATIVMLFFSSCTKDPEKLLVGKWKVVSAVCNDHSDAFYDGFIEAFSYDEGETWTFQEDGIFKGYMNALSYFLNGTNSNLISSSIKCDYVCDDNTIKLRNGNLDVSFFDGYEDCSISFVFTFDIDMISSKEMSLNGKLKITDDEETSTITKIKYELKKK